MLGTSAGPPLGAGLEPVGVTDGDDEAGVPGAGVVVVGTGVAVRVGE